MELTPHHHRLMISRARIASRTRGYLTSRNNMYTGARYFAPFCISYCPINQINVWWAHALIRGAGLPNLYESLYEWILAIRCGRSARYTFKSEVSCRSHVRPIDFHYRWTKNSAHHGRLCWNIWKIPPCSPHKLYPPLTR